MFKEYTDFDGLGLAKLIKAKEVSAKEVLDAAINQANIKNPKLNAIIHRFDKRAYHAITNQLPNGVFSGVPFLLKDLSFMMADEPISMGSRGIRIIPAKDSHLVSRLKSTGVAIFGKTNTPELGLMITTEPKAFGATHNPHKHDFSAGGSSGGSAAAVASSMVPIAGAGDGGGSIRLPAAWCGVFGLKPSRGRTPIGPAHGEQWNGAIIDHVITRSVRDSAAMLDATHGPETGAPYHIAPPSGNFLDAVYEQPRPLRIALSKRPLIDGTKISPEVISALDSTAKQLEQMGHVVEEAEPVIDIHTLWYNFLVVVAAYTAHNYYQIKNLVGEDAYHKLEPNTKNLAMIGRSLSALDLVDAKHGWHEVQLSAGHFFNKFDVMLCPTAPTPAVKHGVLTPNMIDDVLMSSVSHVKLGKTLMKSGLVKKLAHPTLSKMAFTIFANITGLPAMSMPVGMSKKGLPIGIQCVGKMHDEKTLFSIAGECERAGLFTPLPH